MTDTSDVTDASDATDELDDEHAKALLLILSVHVALQEAGWGALLSQWHSGVVALAIRQPVDAPAIDIGPADPPLGPFETMAAMRWRRLCRDAGVDPTDPSDALLVLEDLGLLERRRAVLRRRWAFVEPVPAADRHEGLALETRAAAAVARRRFSASMAIGELLEAGGGRHAATSVARLAADALVDPDLLEEFAADPSAGWRITPDQGGGVVLEEIPEAERDAALAALDALPDEEFGP